MGQVGAGTGATTGKWRGQLAPSGIGWAVRDAGPARVAAVIVVNAWGDVLPSAGKPGEAESDSLQNTTVGVVLTTARLSKTDCFLLAQSGSTGYARAIHPAHSRYDGDAVVALATGEITGDVNLDLLRATATEVVVEAISLARGNTVAP